MRHKFLILAAFVLGLVLAEWPGNVTPGGVDHAASASGPVAHVAMATVTPPQGMRSR